QIMIILLSGYMYEMSGAVCAPDISMPGISAPGESGDAGGGKGSRPLLSSLGSRLMEVARVVGRSWASHDSANTCKASMYGERRLMGVELGAVEYGYRSG